jgi:hypothetical protein
MSLSISSPSTPLPSHHCPWGCRFRMGELVVRLRATHEQFSSTHNRDTQESHEINLSETSRY